MRCKGIMKKKKKATKNSSAFSEAIGFGQAPFGFGGSGPTIQPVSSTTPLFTNLRWYLVSNMRQLLSELFMEIGLIQTVVCVPVDDGLRGGVMFKSKQLDEDQIKKLQITMDREADLRTAGWAGKWMRLYGGGGILILVDDQDPEFPLDLAAIGPDTNVEFRAVDMWELFWDKQNIEGYDFEIQEHDFEYYNYYSEKIHKSRVMRLKGLEAPSFLRPRLRGWGVSIVEILVRSINQYLKAVDLGYEVLDEFKIDVYRIKNLANTLLSYGGQNKVKERIQLTNWSKSYNNAIVMDLEDEYAQKQLSFSGLAEAMSSIRMQVASDLRMPITKIFGTSVSGGFTTDQNDMENYNSMVESEIREKLKYDILRMAEIRCQQLFGMIPEDLEAEWKPLRELTAVDQETVKTQKFTRLETAAQSGRITTEEYRDACNKGNLFDVQLDGNVDGLTPKDDAYAESGKVDEEPGANKEYSRKVHI